MRGLRVPLSVRCAAPIVALLVWAGDVGAQPQLGNLLPNPRLTTVNPPGGKVGSSFEVTFTGTDLELPESLVFSHPGITAKAIQPEAPKEDPKAKDDPKTKQPDMKDKPAPQVSKFTVTIAADVPVGNHDVRLVGKYGISNARSFAVGDLTEVQEKEPNNDVDQAQRVELNSTINGTIAQPTDVDYYVFAGKKGQRVLIHCMAASIDSKLTPEIKVVDKDNREIAAGRAAPLNDSMVDLTLPEDGDFKVRLVQFAHQLGGPDLFYRLTITTGPWIDAVFPPMVEPGKETEVTVYGRNLPGGKSDPAVVVGDRTLESVKVKITPPKGSKAKYRLQYGGNVLPTVATLDGFEYRIKNAVGMSNPFLITYAQAPVVLGQEHVGAAPTPQMVKVPCEIAGHINSRGGRDFYAFDAKKGDTYMIEVFSHRLGAPTDLYLTIKNATTKMATDLAVLDDTPESLSPTQLVTSSRDPLPFKFVAPADGQYQLLLGNHLSTTQADVTHYYKVRITPEKPDFRLVVMPADTYRPDTCVLGQGGNQDLMVFVQREDGFKGEVAVTVEGLPPGVTYKPQFIGPSMKVGAIVLNAALDAKPWAGSITIKGSSVINGRKVEREARSASITWPVQPQSGIPTITRLERTLVLAVRDKAPYNLACEVDKFTVLHGDKVTIPLKLTRHWPEFKQALQVIPIPQELPAGVTFGPVTLAPGKDEAKLALNVPANVPPGRYTFVFKSFAPIPTGPKGKAVNVVQCSTAVVLTVVPKQVATLTISNAAPAVKVGDEVELVLKVARLHDFNGPFKIKLLMPPDVKGLIADEMTIEPGQSEVKLYLQADDDAAPGPRNNITVQATCELQGLTLTHETKINVNVTK
jgi:hypothetical protein